MSAEDKVLTKAQLGALWLSKHWMWIALAALIIGGSYALAEYLFKNRKGEKKAE